MMLMLGNKIRLVFSNDITVSYFNDYTDAVNFLIDAYKDRLPNPKLVSNDQFARIISKLCEKKIQCYEDDNLICNYRVKVKR